ncbi:MAG: M1 family metallopeptidase, partial [Myxococcota bacterium]
MACLHHAGLDQEPIPFAEPGVKPRYPVDRTVRIRHVAVTLSVDPAERSFRGEATVTLEPYPAFAGVVRLDLDEVEVLGVSVDGAPVPYEHTDGQVVIRVATVPPEIVLRWRGADPRRGLYFTGPTETEPDRPHTAWTQCQDEDGHFVFPCHDHPSVKHPWTLSLDAPAGYTLLSNGEQVDAGERDGRAFARFEQREPMPAYLVTFVAAPLAVVETTWRDRPVRYLVPIGRESSIERAFGRTPAMIEHFSDRTGVDYPWPRYDQVVVHDFVFGGMENVACTTMTELLLVDEKADLESQGDALVSHELAHQWFGDLVTCEDWSQAWLNESWATFMEAVWWEHAHRDEPAAGVWYRWTAALGYHAEHSGRYRRPIVSYDYREPIDLFDRHLYNKGSCVLWTLRHHLGESAFWAGVRAYLEANRDDTVHTRHFQRAMERTTGVNLERFFAQWVHAPGHPVVEVKLGRDGERQITVDVKQTQSGDGVPEAFAFGLRLEVVTDGGTRVVELAVGERQRVFVVPVDGPVSYVRVDPGYNVLAELKLKGPDAWLEALLADPCPVLALRAARGLLSDGSARGFAAVAGALRSHPFWGTRGALADELGRVPTDAALTVLVDALRAEADPRARRSIAHAIGQFRKP